MSAEVHDTAEDGAKAAMESSESTAFYMWLIITVSAGIIMAQDTWVSVQQPRLSTVDATAAFTKVMVIHFIWLVITIGFMVFTWFIRPTSAWKIHLIVGALTIFWTVGVLAWSFADVERLQVSTYRCESPPGEMIATESFLDSCTLADNSSSIRLGGDIFLWSADDEHYWRWIVPGEGLATLQTKWPRHVSAMYMAIDAPGAELTAGALDSIPGGNWSAKFDPHDSLHLRLFLVETAPTVPLEPATPDEINGLPLPKEYLYHERYRATR